MAPFNFADWVHQIFLTLALEQDNFSCALLHLNFSPKSPSNLEIYQRQQSDSQDNEPLNVYPQFILDSLQLSKEPLSIQGLPYNQFRKIYVETLQLESFGKMRRGCHE